MLSDLTHSEKVRLIYLWEQVLRDKPEFGECFKEIESEFNTLMAMNLDSTVEGRLLSIMGNVLTMSVIFNSLIAELKEVPNHDYYNKNR